MHDTFLNERIYEGLLKLCQEYKIKRLSKVVITVNIDSHISEKSLRDLFIGRHSKLIDTKTEVVIKKQDAGKLNAIIEGIEGEPLDE